VSVNGERFADLQLHSTASDGSDSPSEVVRRAARKGFAAIALTDHDTMQGVPEADIIDAAFRLAVTAAARLYGPEAVSHSLLDMAEVVRAATDPGAH